MKARLPITRRLSKSAREAVKEYNSELQAETFRRWLKLSCVALHSANGFGHDRCADFLAEISRLAETEKQDEIFWRHIDKVVREEMKLDFEAENYEMMEEK